MFYMVPHSWQAIGGFPASDAEVASGNSPHLPKKSAPARVLVVDDEALVRWSIGETLAERGYEVSEAADAASAIEALAADGAAVDVVLLDLRLPDCDDLRALSAMRRLSPHVPVILMTAYGTPELFADAHRVGAFAILHKPFEMAAVTPIVEHALAARPH